MMSAFFLSLYLITSLVVIIYFSIWGIALFTLHEKASTPTTPGVSVIVACHNEKSNLNQLLPALQSQTHEKYEVIIVNDRSTDGSGQLLNDWKATWNRLKVINISETPGFINSKKYALIKGVEASCHENLLLTDGDCRPLSTHWINNMTAALNTKQVVIGVSLYKKRSGLLNYFIRYEALLTALQYLGFARFTFPYMAVGRNLAYKKELFDNFKDYENITGGDDDLFIQRNATADNFHICYKKVGQTLSEPKESWKSFARQKLRHLSVGKLYSLKSQFFLGFFNISYLLNWLLLPVVLLLATSELYMVVISFFIRTLVMCLSLNIAKNKLKAGLNLLGLLILELIFAGYYISIGFMALFTKKVKWS